MFKKIRYWFWKRRAKKAVAAGLSTNCGICNHPIVPGDFVGMAFNGRQKMTVVHAGSHFSLSNQSAFCVTDAVGVGFWNGKQIVLTNEPIALTAMKTGQTEVG